MKTNLSWKTTIILFFLNVPLLLAQEWELAKEKDGIIVFTRESPESPVKEFKAATIIEVEIEEIELILKDFRSYVHWYDHCKKAELISKEPDGSLTYYMEYNMPFPFSNRDAVLSLNSEEETEQVEIKIMRKAGILDEKEGVVRMPVSEGSWRLIKIDQSKTRIEHRFKGDPAGNIPAGIANLFLVAGPVNTLGSLKKFALARVK